MTSDLKAVVLDKLAKDRTETGWGFKSWKEYSKEETFKDANGTEVTKGRLFTKDTLILAVELALEAKQAEVLEEIDKFYEEILKDAKNKRNYKYLICDDHWVKSFKENLKKRLLIEKKSGLI